MALTKAQIFDPAFLDSLKHLRIVARRVPRGGRFAEQRSVDAGGGIDFKDFRPYSPGDDFRSIDWNIYQRLGKVFLRLYEELEDLPLYLVPDVSRSLFVEEPPRIISCLRATLALASISLHHHDTVGVFPFSDELGTLWRPQSGVGKLVMLADRLAEVQPGRRTNVERAMDDLNGMDLRRGLVVVLSDFFDPRGVEAVIGGLKRVRHRLLLVQIVRVSDRLPGVTGDLRLVDCESGDAQDVSVTDGVRQRYARSYDAFQSRLNAFARQRGAGLLRLDVEADITDQLATLFETGSYAVA